MKNEYREPDLLTLLISDVITTSDVSDSDDPGNEEKL